MLVNAILDFKFPQAEKWPRYWRWTEATHCPRQLLHRAYMTPALPPKPEQMLLMEDGLMHEADMKIRLKVAGIPVREFPKEGMTTGKTGLPLVFHPDGVITIDGTEYVFEFKTMNTNLFENVARDGMAAHKPEYIKQVDGYMWATDIPRAIFLCKCRETAALYEEVYLFPGEQVNIKPILANVELAWTYFQAGEPPDIMACTSDFFERMFCPWAEVDGPLPRELVDDAAIVAALRWHETKILIDDLEPALKNSKAVIRQCMEALGETTMDINLGQMGGNERIRAHVAQVTRTGIGLDDARSVLSPSILERITKQSSYEQFTVIRVKPRG
jgi:hypothetical protein